MPSEFYQILMGSKSYSLILSYFVNAQDLKFLSDIKSAKNYETLEIIMSTIDESDIEEKEEYFFKVLAKLGISNYNYILLCALERSSIFFSNHLVVTLINNYDIDKNYNPVRYVGLNQYIWIY